MSKVILETGKYYWCRQKHERIWRICYIGQDSDERQWYHLLGCGPAVEVSQMDLSYFDWLEIPFPG